MLRLVGLLSLLITVLASSRAYGAATEQEFYRGKTIRIIVGFAAGGGFDAYARVIARHMGKHIPSNPSIIVDNMTGAGSRVAANFLFRAPPDGQAIGNFIGSLVLQQIMGDKGIEFDGRKFEWLGAPVQDENVCALTRASGVNSLEDWFAAKKPVKLGGDSNHLGERTRVGNGASDYPDQREKGRGHSQCPERNRFCQNSRRPGTC